MHKYFFITFLLVLTSSSASFASNTDFYVGVGLMKFKYDEYKDNNVFLDGESGFIPGIVLKLKQRHINLYTEWIGQLYGNTIDYDGQTQGGSPLQTKSDAIIFDTHYKLGFHFSELQSQGVYLGLGYRYWLRNIRPGYDINENPVAGLLEHYYWFYGLLGYSTSYAASENVNVGFDIRHTQMMNAKMDVDFLGYKNYDNTQVNLGNKSGLRFAVPVQIKTGTRSLIVSPYYEIIDIGRSNDVVITRDGIPVTGCISDPCKIHEPRSETRNVGVEMIWIW